MTENHAAAAESERRLFGILSMAAFVPFGYRDFRVLWSVNLVRSAALWLDMVAKPVLIVELTGSPILLGATLAARMAPNLVLAPLTGLIIDRYPFRRVQMSAMATSAVSSAVLFVLLVLDQAQGWHVIAMSAVAGISVGIFNPGQRAVLPTIVEPTHLRPAMALSQTGQTSMRMGGALMAGLILQFADFTTMFGVMTILNVCAALLVTLVRTPQDSREPPTEPQVSVLQQLMAGIRWAVEARWPLAVLACTTALFTFLQPYEGVMVPLIVIDELGAHRSWVGYLVAIGGIGATAGSVALASVKSIPSPNALMVGLMVTGGIVLLVLSQAPHIAVVAVCVLFGGACVNNGVALANLALLSQAPDHMRGQALALMNLVLGAILIGAMFAGALADAIGPRTGLMTMGICLLAATLLALSTPRLRWWLWRRQQYVNVSREEWLQIASDDR